MRILCVHGWAFDPTMWSAMNGRLRDLMQPSQWQMQCVDLGFYQSDNQTDSMNYPTGRFDVAIGHSFGLLWLLKNQQIEIERLVSVNGFTRFSAAEDFQCGCPHRIIHRMRKGLAQDSRRAIGDFMENSATAQWANQTGLAGRSVDIERLDWALEALLNQDGREQWCQFDGPRRVIAATKDRIVSQEQTQTCFPASDVQWLKTDSHCIPVQFPEICAALIRELIETT